MTSPLKFIISALATFAMLTGPSAMAAFKATSTDNLSQHSLCSDVFAGSAELRAAVREGFLQGDHSALHRFPMVARVLRGKTPENFKSLTDDKTRRIIFLMDNDGLDSIAGLKGDARLEQLGYTKDYIKDLRGKGTQFKLVVFRNSGQFLPATWENLARMVSRVYPARISALFQRHLLALQRMSFAEIDRMAPAPLKKLNELGAENPLYITAERLTEQSALWEVRAFLYNELRVTELYTGTGFTENPDGSRGIPEYLGVDVPIASIPDHVLMNMEDEP